MFKSCIKTEIDKLSKYMHTNGMELSGEKTSLMLFNNGINPKHLPKLELDGTELVYKQQIKFLGVHMTPKLSWKLHIENLIIKARKGLNLIKVVNAQPWGQDTKTLLHLALSFVRSRLTYGQEVYHSAPKHYLKRLESLDSKAIKIAIGVPIHTNTSKCYTTVGILSLSEQRQAAVAKYVIRGLSVQNSVTEDMKIDKADFPKRSQNVSYLTPIKKLC